MNKKGISIIIGYVLLVVIAISLSLLVYAWLKGYIPKQEQGCPDEVSLIINNYACDNANREISLTIKNNGFFNVDGFIAKSSNLEGGLPIHALKATEPIESDDEQFFFDEALKPNEEFTNKFSYYDEIIEIEIIPLRKSNREIFLCKAAIKQEVQGCG